MSDEQPKNPLHGITLSAILEALIAQYGWDDLATRIPIRCFTHDRSVSSSLKFLRKTDWARARVEALFLAEHRRVARNQKRKQRRLVKAEHDAAADVAEPAAASDLAAPTTIDSEDAEE